ncbi:hypothetical protein [Geosporobacter ferrireducens]|uniref:Transposase n=1 Tax=Geosporobacter ferrireducens TaxID=1424294 RepID=A0A1D8GBM3_9FIRM|nr:hypothetical protein [Geosporobacter ferrireducens]AOT68317.1 hypothetical protein Gferi_01155 [Geosporobacter ferrireducens]
MREGKIQHQAITCIMRRLVNIIYGMMKNKTEYVQSQVLNTRLRVPLISTGSKLGNIFEERYVLTLLVTSIVSFVIFDGSIKLI